MQTLFSASMVGIDTSLERISLERPSLDKNHSTHVVELRGTDAMCPASMAAGKTSRKETLKTMIKRSRTYCRESPGLKWCFEELHKLSLLPEKWSKKYNMKSPILQPLLAEGRTLEGIRANPGIVRRKKGVAGAIRDGTFWVADEIEMVLQLPLKSWQKEIRKDSSILQPLLSDQVEVSQDEAPKGNFQER
ncbi:hypothetical protein HO133_010190 [Letharia lupina]|uniref:Uncharacterized protein n=1 Tax=Letharia lupina TaxID=560253 RepID=A0A8H6CKH7_9LECA|nr:uncharacterized protein HO133_010190 [Letharia lupina]KAF6224995.1 hypothetical protein HO133_010190 [Letharia lupina]